MVIRGRNTPRVFCMGIPLAVLANLVLNLPGYGLSVQVAINVIGLLIMVGTGVTLAWFNAGGRFPGAPIEREAS